MLSCFDIDIYSKNFEFNLDKKSFKSISGRVFTYVFSIFFLVLVFFQGKDIFYMVDPDLTVLNLYYNEHQKIVSDQNNNITIAVRLEETFNKFLTSPEYFEYDFVLNTVKFSDDGEFIINPETNSSITTLNSSYLVNCTTLKFLGEDNLKMMNQFLCINMPFEIYGNYYITKNLTWPSIRIKRCNNDTEKRYNLTCNQRVKDIKKFFFKMIYQINVFQKENYSSPTKVYFDEYSTSLADEGPNAYERTYVNIYYSKSSINDYDNLFLSDSIKNTNFTELNLIETEKRLYEYTIAKKNNITEDFLISVTLLTSRLYKLYDRKYIKLINLIGDVGGILSILTYVFDIIILPITDVEYKSYLVFKMFKIEIDESSDKDKDPVDLKKFKVEDNDLRSREKNLDKERRVDEESKSSKISLIRFVAENRDETIAKNLKKESISNRPINEELNMTNPIADVDNKEEDKAGPNDNEKENKLSKANFLFDNKCEALKPLKVTFNPDISETIRIFSRPRKRVVIAKGEWFMHECFQCLSNKNNSRQFLLEKMTSEVDLKSDIFNLFSKMNQIEFIKHMFFPTNEVDKLEKLTKEIIILNQKKRSTSCKSDLKVKDSFEDAQKLILNSKDLLNLLIE